MDVTEADFCVAGDRWIGKNLSDSTLKGLELTRKLPGFVTRWEPVQGEFQSFYSTLREERVSLLMWLITEIRNKSTALG